MGFSFIISFEEALLLTGHSQVKYFFEGFLRQANYMGSPWPCQLLRVRLEAGAIGVQPVV
jgi:hypothetical protein